MSCRTIVDGKPCGLPRSVRARTWNICDFHYDEHKKVRNRRKRLNKSSNVLCGIGGHIFKAYENKRKCIRCDWVIGSAEKMLASQNRSRKTNIGKYFYSEMFSIKLDGYYRQLKEFRFVPYSDTAKVANVLYYLRYDKGWEAQDIEKEFNISPITLNRYLFAYPWVPGMEILKKVKANKSNSHRH